MENETMCLQDICRWNWKFECVSVCSKSNHTGKIPWNSLFTRQKTAILFKTNSLSTHILLLRVRYVN